jgi:hypothetical protein
MDIKITNEEFDEALSKLLDESPASHLLSVPGVYEILSEHFNNDVLDILARVDRMVAEASKAPADTSDDMTFEEFTATRAFHEDLRVPLPDWGFPEDSPTPRGYVYRNTLAIEEVTAEWPEASRKAGKFYLQLGNEEYIRDTLHPLEVLLYEYAKSEGLARKA